MDKILGLGRQKIGEYFQTVVVVVGRKRQVIQRGENWSVDAAIDLFQGPHSPRPASWAETDVVVLKSFTV